MNAKEKILLVAKRCTCGSEERKFFVMIPVIVDHPLVCSTFVSRPLTDTTIDIALSTAVVERQTVEIDACSRCVAGRDVFAEREERKLIADDVAEFIQEREEWEYAL